MTDINTLTQMRALANPTRTRIITLISDTAMTVGEIAEALGAAPASISYHLKQLEKSGLAQRAPSPDGDARKSCWTAPNGLNLDAWDKNEDANVFETAQSTIRAMHMARSQAFDRFTEHADDIEDWRSYTHDADYTFNLTSQEAIEMSNELQSVINSWISRTSGDITDDERQIMVSLTVIPYIP